MISQPIPEIPPMILTILLLSCWLMNKHITYATQKKQKVPFNMDVIFKVFSVFITSPLSIISHYRKNVKVEFGRSIATGVVYGVIYWIIQML